MFGFLLLVVTSTLCYYLSILSTLMALLSTLWKLALVAILAGAVLLVWRRYRVPMSKSDG